MVKFLGPCLLCFDLMCSGTLGFLKVRGLIQNKEEPSVGLSGWNFKGLGLRHCPCV